jgi:putative ribosome biogenesis GTPase RsgA
MDNQEIIRLKNNISILDKALIKKKNKNLFNKIVILKSDLFKEEQILTNNNECNKLHSDFFNLFQ